MDAEPLQDKLWQKIRAGNFEGFNGANLSFRIPVKEGLLNSLTEDLISSVDSMQDFNRIHFRDIAFNQFTVDVSHKKLNKSIRCEITGISHNQESDRVLTLTFVEGVKFYEKIAIDSAMVFRKGLNWFRSAMKEEPETAVGSGSWYELSSGSIKINIDKLLRQQKLDYLNKIVHWEKFLADDNTFIIKFSIKT